MNLGFSNSSTSNNPMSNNSRNSNNSKKSYDNKQMNNVFTGTSRNNKTSYGGHDFELNNGILSVNKNGKKSQTVLTNGSSTFISPPKGNSPPKFTLFQSDDSFAKASNEGGNLVLYGLLYSHMNESDIDSDIDTDTKTDSNMLGSQFNGSMTKDINKNSLYKYKLVNSIVDDLEEIKGNMNLTGMLSSSSHFQGILMKLALVDKLMESDETNKASEPATTTTNSTTTTTTTQPPPPPTYYPGLRWVSYPVFYNNSTAYLNTLMDSTNVETWTKTSGVGLTNPNIYSGNSYNFSSLTGITTSNNTSGLSAFTKNSGQKFFSILCSGYFKPNISGQWIFSLGTDDSGYLWVNNDSIPITKVGITSTAGGVTTNIVSNGLSSNYSNSIKSFSTFSPTNISASGLVLGDNSNALINSGKPHGWTFFDAPANFTANKYYPIVILYGQNTNSYDFVLKITDPNGVQYSSNCSGLFFNTVSN